MGSIMSLMTQEVLAPYFGMHIPELGALHAVEKLPGGQSNPTYKLSCDSGTYVLRAKPEGKLLKSAHMVEREFRVMQALAASDVAVPRMIHLAQEDQSPIGRAFFVMSYAEGRIFWDPALPDCTPSERAAIYDAMNAALASLHRVDPDAVGLGDFGKPGNYFSRQTERWTGQYLSSRQSGNAQMDRIIDWLSHNMVADDGQVALVHGDYRLDNMVFAADAPEIVALLDWELSTLGHPLADLAYQCMQWRLPNDGKMRGLAGIDRTALGLPKEADYVARYCERRGISKPENWTFYLVFSFFRLAAILEGVGRRAADGNASNPQAARAYAQAVPVLASMAADLIDEAAI